MFFKFCVISNNALVWIDMVRELIVSGDKVNEQIKNLS